MELANYTILNEIGRNSRSTSYLGRRNRDGRSVVIKEFLIPPDTQSEFVPKYVERYMSECRWLAQVSHPNIVEVLDVMPPSSGRLTPILVIECLDKSLHRILQERKIVEPQQAVGWLVQILTGIRAFHEHHIIHRDIKPANVMLSTTECPKIIDVSIAVQVGQEITLSPDDISTKYAAPEMYRGRSGANFATDVYSAGFMAYEMLCGQTRFLELFKDVLTDNERENLLRWMNWHCDEATRLPPLSEVVPEVPPYLSEIVERMTAKKLTERYQTVGDILEDLYRQASKGNDIFSLAINQCVASDYWRNPGHYKLAEDEASADGISRLTAEKDVSARKGIGSALTPKKRLLLLVGLFYALILIGGGTWYAFHQMAVTRTINELESLRTKAITAYRDSDYAVAKAESGNGLTLLKQIDGLKKYNRFTLFFEYLSEDAERIEVLETRLKEAMGAVEAGKLDDALVAANGILEEKYERGQRENDLDQLTSEKLKSVQDRAKELLADIARKKEEERLAKLVEETTRQIDKALDEGKVRKAQYIFMSAEPAVQERLASTSKEKLEPILTKLDEGQRLFDEKNLAASYKAFRDAYDLSGQKSIEAYYFIEKLSLALNGPAARNLMLSAPKCLESRIINVMASMTECFFRKYDLAQTDQDPEIERLRAEWERLKDELTSMVEEARKSNGSVFEAESNFPIEDSKSYYRSLLKDLYVLDLQLKLEAGNIKAARDCLAAAEKYGLNSAEKDFLEARLQEEPELGGVPEQAFEHYKALVNTHPDWADCYARMGIILFVDQRERQLDAALEAFSRAVALAPNNIRYRWWGARFSEQAAAEVLGAVSSEGGGADHSKESARELCGKALQFWPKFPCALFTLAVSFFPEDPQKVLEYLEQFEEAYNSREYKGPDEDDLFSETLPKLRKDCQARLPK